MQENHRCLVSNHAVKPTLLTIQKINDDNPGGIWEEVHIPHCGDFFGIRFFLISQDPIQTPFKTRGDPDGVIWVLGSYETPNKKARLSISIWKVSTFHPRKKLTNASPEAIDGETKFGSSSLLQEPCIFRVNHKKSHRGG